MPAKYIELINAKSMPFRPSQITNTAINLESPDPKGILPLKKK